MTVSLNQTVPNPASAVESPTLPLTPTKLSCSLRWRQDRLWVSSTTISGHIPLPALANEEWFRACLVRSRAHAVYIDPLLGSEVINLWAKACAEAHKPLYLRIPSMVSLPQKKYPLAWWVKGVCDRVAAALLLCLLSPLMLLIALLIKLHDGGPVFYSQWRVGERGKLFRIFKFRSMVPHAELKHNQVMGSQPGLHKLKDDPRITELGKWLRKLSLDELPQLVNVLRGEMSLVGPRPWAIYDAVRIAPGLRCRLNALPGITGAWQVEKRSEEVDISSVNQRDLAYLKEWTAWQDLKFLLLTLPKIITASGAY